MDGVNKAVRSPAWRVAKPRATEDAVLENARLNGRAELIARGQDGKVYVLADTKDRTRFQGLLLRQGEAVDVVIQRKKGGEKTIPATVLHFDRLGEGLFVLGTLGLGSDGLFGSVARRKLDQELTAPVPPEPAPARPPRRGPKRP